MDGKIVVRINSKTCILTILLSIAFSAALAFCMYKLIELFYLTGCTECTVAKFIFVAYPAIFIAVAFTLAGYLMVIGELEENKERKLFKRRKRKSK